MKIEVDLKLSEFRYLLLPPNHPGPIPAPKIKNNIPVKIPGLGIAKNFGNKMKELDHWFAIFDFVSNSILGKMFCQKYKRGEAQVLLTQHPPWKGAPIRFQFSLTQEEWENRRVQKALDEYRKSEVKKERNFVRSKKKLVCKAGAKS